MWFCHHSWFGETQWGAVLVSLICQSINNFSPRCLLRHVPTIPWVLVDEFLFEPPSDLLCHVLVSTMVFAFCFEIPMWLPCSPIGDQLLGFATLQPLASICASWWWSVANARSILSGCFSHCLKLGALCYSSCHPWAFPVIWWGIQLWGLAESPDPSAFLKWWGGIFFSGGAPSSDTVNSESVMEIKPGDSGVWLDIRLMNFLKPGKWVFHCSFTIFSWFHDEICTLTYFPFEPGCYDFSFWTRL